MGLMQSYGQYAMDFRAGSNRVDGIERLTKLSTCIPVY